MAEHHASDAAHDHGGHDEHGGQHDHDHGGHGGHDSHDNDHSGGHGHAEHWGDYNSQPPGPSTLPAVGSGALAFLGLGLSAAIIALLSACFSLTNARVNLPHSSAEHGKSHAEYE